MRFVTRLVLTLSVATGITVTGAFVAASAAVDRSEEHQLDEALRKEARQEAYEVAAYPGELLRISDRGGPLADDVGRLTKYAAIYGADDRTLDHTPTFSRGVPALSALHAPRGVPFDLVYEGEALRAVLVEIPAHPGHHLLLGAPRSDLEKDRAFLHKVMLLAAALSIACTSLIMWRVVRRLTRGHAAIAATARRVAAGDLAARVALRAGDDEVVQLAGDVDEMVRQLSALVEGQQRFVANAAHELRSPFATLYGELQFALRRVRTADEYRHTIEEALDSAARLKLLTEDLLTLARLGRGPEISDSTLSIGELSRAAVRTLGDEAIKKDLVIDVETDGSWVRGRPRDLERLMRNLLDNAIRHSSKGGRVRVGAHADGDQVVVTVEDEGSGVPEVERQRVFEPFFRAAAERQRDGGSGLGLAIVREIARGHGGDVTLEERASGPGALFRVRLRRSSSAPDLLTQEQSALGDDPVATLETPENP